MFIEINENIFYESDDITLIHNDIKLWFKGYFFIDELFHSGTEARNFLMDVYLNSKIDNNINEYNGIFTCVIVNTVTSEILIFNDRFGFGQLFYVFEENKCFISDDFWMLQKRAGKNNLNIQGVYEMLMTRYVFSDGTLVQGIKQVLSASIYKIRILEGIIKFEHKCYWNFSYNPKVKNQEDAEIELYGVLKNIINRYKEKAFENSRIGLNLTGGLDSRFLIGLLLKNNISPDRIKTFTFGKKNSDDIIYAGAVANVLGIDHTKLIFDDNFSDFFKSETIDEILHQIGFSTYYFQGYGVGKLMKEYDEIDYLLTGSDGFFVGLMSNEVLFKLKNKNELVDYIFKKNATILSQGQCNYMLKNPVNIEQNIKDRIADTLPDSDTGLVSGYYNWTIQNRLRKYILSIYEMLNKKTLALFPFYDYEFIDLMASFPFELLSGQKIYFNAMYKFCFTESLHDLAALPVEYREKVRLKGQNYIVRFKKYKLFYRIVKKVFAMPEKFFPYPIYSFFKQHYKEFTRLTGKLINNESAIIKIQNVSKLLKKNRRKEFFFRYGLLAIISVLRFERLLKSRIGKK